MLKIKIPPVTTTIVLVPILVAVPSTNELNTSSDIHDATNSNNTSSGKGNCENWQWQLGLSATGIRFMESGER